MNRMKRNSIALIVLTVFLFLQTLPSALAYDKYQDEIRSGSDMLADLVIARPIGTVGIVLGFVGFIVSLPFSVTGDNVSESYQKLVVKPAKYTWKRPLGEFQEY